MSLMFLHLWWSVVILCLYNVVYGNFKSIRLFCSIFKPVWICLGLHGLWYFDKVCVLSKRLT